MHTHETDAEQFFSIFERSRCSGEVAAKINYKINLFHMPNNTVSVSGHVDSDVSFGTSFRVSRRDASNVISFWS